MFWSFANDPIRPRGGLLPNNRGISMLRRLALDDMDLAAKIHRVAFDHALPTLAGLHTPDEDRWFYRERMFPTCQLWGAFDASEMLGVIAFPRRLDRSALRAAVGARARRREQAARRCATRI